MVEISQNFVAFTEYMNFIKSKELTVLAITYILWPKGNKMDYILEAMQKGIPGQKDAQFTTVGKPRVS